MPEEPTGEGYSRKAYEEEERKLAQAKEGISPDRPTEELEAAVGQMKSSEGKMGRQKEMAFDEALELNRQYDELWAKKEAAEKEITDFRREKLEMREPEREKPERTRETEIKANVEFWQGLGIEVDEAEIRAAIEALPEKEGFDWFHYIPQGIKNSEAWQKMAERFPNWKWDGVGNLDEIKMPRETQEAYAIASRYNQEPDEDSLGEGAKSAQNWEKTDDQFMSPLERMIAEMRWMEENGSHLDEKSVTLCPGSRAARVRVPCLPFFRSFSGGVPCLRFYSPDGKVCLFSKHPGLRDPSLGVRRVVSKES